MFGAATHCPLQPISRVVYKDTTMTLNQLTDGKIAEGISDMLLKKMRGPTDHEWITPFE